MGLIPQVVEIKPCVDHPQRMGFCILYVLCDAHMRVMHMEGSAHTTPSWLALVQTTAAQRICRAVAGSST